jgi:hypothetical protein
MKEMDGRWMRAGAVYRTYLEFLCTSFFTILSEVTFNTPSPAAPARIMNSEAANIYMGSSDGTEKKRKKNDRQRELRNEYKWRKKAEKRSQAPPTSSSHIVSPLNQAATNDTATQRDSRMHRRMSGPLGYHKRPFKDQENDCRRLNSNENRVKHMRVSM